jgi:acetyl esterase/lipase
MYARPLLLMMTLLSACSPVWVLNALAPRDGVTRAEDLTYASGPRHGIDVYAPTPMPKDAPVVVFFYGGSWEEGTRQMYRFVGATLAAHGIVAFIPDYRLYPKVRFPTFIQDGAQAVAWAREHAAAYGGDPSHLFLMGHSAGAQIATLLTLDSHWLNAVGMDPDRDITGTIGLAGPYDFLPLQTPTLKAIFGAPSEWPASQPINFVTPGAPPMFLAAGSDDKTVDPGNTTRLAARLRANHDNVEVHMYPGIGHATLMGAFAPALTLLAPVRDDVLHFIDNHTQHSGAGG